MSTHPRHVLITGGSRGIGLSIAKLFSQHNYRCTLISRNESSLKDAIAQLHPLTPSSPTNEVSHPLQHAYIPGDITTRALFWNTDPTHPFGKILPKPRTSEAQHTSKIDILVNCAGISQAKLFTQTSDDEIHNVLTLNLSSMMMGTRFLLRNGYLRGKVRGGRKATGDAEEEGEGEGKGSGSSSPSIINVASLLGVSGGYGSVAYAASKAGVLGFTRALATEYVSHGVRVNAIVPGYIATDMTAGLDEQQLKQRIPLGRFGKPEEIAHAALFLAENQYAHNCVMNLDGGLSAV
jgi:NAD(P)-dependent dehydrogenase (short-subunit alcohol dehydrogenase family)